VIYYYDSLIEVLGDCVVSFGLKAATLIQLAITSTRTKYHMPGRKHALNNVTYIMYFIQPMKNANSSY